MTPHSRGLLAAAAAAAAALLLVASLVVGYAARVFFDADQFANHASAALEREAVRDEVSRRVTDDLVLGADADLVGIRPIIETAVSEVVGGAAFRGILRAGVRDVHRAIFDRDQSTVTLTLADVGIVVRSTLEQLAPKAAARLPRTEDAVALKSDPPDWLASLVQMSEEVRGLVWILLVTGLVLGVVSLVASPHRRRTASLLGLAIATAALVAFLALGIVRARLLGQVTEPDVEAAAGELWDVFLGDLGTVLAIAAAAGAVIAAAAKSLIRPRAVEAPILAAWRAVTTAPESTWLRALRGVGLLATGLVVVLEPAAMLRLVVTLAGLYVLYKGVEELLRLVAQPPPQATVGESQAGVTPRPRRTIAALAGAGALIAAGFALFAGLGGAQAPTPASAGCNGSRELCDRPLDEVVFPATHNAMSGADVPNYLFPSQEMGIPAQLADGIRGLLIDTHYGVPSESGQVKTDLSDIDGGERETYAREIGERGLNAALRIRDRLVVGSGGERALYMCHRFCELGAVALVPALRQVRDFLVANPGEVLVVVNEDYVKPEDFVAAIEDAGLDELAYQGPLGSRRPTLGELVRSGQRLVVMAENEAGAAPWYRDAYGDVLKETPFSFDRPRLLTDEAKLADSCEANRGSEDNPLFLLNHWIDTSPSPRPSNAKKVNTRPALLARADECERLRGDAPNLVAIDFYLTGELVDAVRELNGVGG